MDKQCSYVILLRHFVRYARSSIDRDQTAERVRYHRAAHSAEGHLAHHEERG